MIVRIATIFKTKTAKYRPTATGRPDDEKYDSNTYNPSKNTIKEIERRRPYKSKIIPAKRKEITSSAGNTSNEKPVESVFPIFDSAFSSKKRPWMNAAQQRIVQYLISFFVKNPLSVAFGERYTSLCICLESTTPTYTIKKKSKKY